MKTDLNERLDTCRLLYKTSIRRCTFCGAKANCNPFTVYKANLEVPSEPFLSIVSFSQNVRQQRIPPMLQSPSTRNRCRQILHVDDDPSILRIVQKRLEDEGISVISLEDSRQTIQTIQSTGVQAVLLDIDMPHFDGIEVLKQIKKYNGNIQVIMLTGLVSQLTAIQAMSNGAEYCIFKPIIEPSKLLQAIDLTFSKIALWENSLHELKIRRTAQLQSC